MTNVEPSYARGSIYVPLGVLALGLFTVATNAVVIAGLLPEISHDFGVSPSQASYAITYYAVVVGVASPALSILLPRVSRTRLMAAGAFVVAAGSIVAAVAPDLTIFTVGRVIAALGGAALVPAATAAAAAIARPEQRGRAIAFVALGFTAANALGAPLGTWIGAHGGWRLPLVVLVGVAVINGVLVLLFVRDIPIPPVMTVGARFAVLKDSRLLAVLAANVLITAGYNVVYFFSSSIATEVTRADGALLAMLLLCFGVAGVAGNALSGPVTDRVGNRVTASVALTGEVVVFVLLIVVGPSFLAWAVLYAVWGVFAFGSVVPVQHRLVALDPAQAGIALSWFTSAMYVGIALAPVLGSATIATVGAHGIPAVGAIATVLALVAFQLAYLRRRVRVLA
jgi:predicted MFS family arabinose efflux permease